MSEICECGHEKRYHHDGNGIWAKGCNQPLAMEMGCPCKLSFTARPDEGDNPLTIPYENGMKLVNQIADLESQLAAERTRREEAEAKFETLQGILELSSITIAGLQQQLLTPLRTVTTTGTGPTQDSTNTSELGASLEANMSESTIKAAREFLLENIPDQLDFALNPDTREMVHQLMTTFAQKVADEQTADLRNRLEAYEQMIAQAYRIEFTDYERVIEKFGVDSIVEPFDLGIIWIVQDEDGAKLSRHATALEAFQALKELQEATK